MEQKVDPVTGDRWIIRNKDEVKLGFLAQCIEELAEEEHCDYVEMFQRLEAANLTEGYILKHYDTLHSESWENIICDLRETLSIREAQAPAI